MSDKPIIDQQSLYWLQKISREVYAKYRDRIIKEVKDTSVEDFMRERLKKAMTEGSRLKDLEQKLESGLFVVQYKEEDKSVAALLERELSAKIQEAISMGLIKVPPREAIVNAYDSGKKKK